ncbi:MAG: GbsR/MarR family transcriptional regulator [Candidatus Woesearchaeota archaeon]
MSPIEREFSETFARLGKQFGLNEIATKIAAIIYVTPGDIAMDDIAHKTGYSLASVSNALKFLGNMGIAEKIRKPGSSKIYVSMEKDIIAINIKKLNRIRDNLKTFLEEDTKKIISRYKESKDKETRQKLMIIKRYAEDVSSIGNLIDGWIKDMEKHRR